MISFLIDFILHIDVHLAELIAQYGTLVYAILFLIVFCETGLVVTPFLPGDSLLFMAGALAASGQLALALVMLTLGSAAILGDSCNYLIGRTVGKRLFANPDSRIFRRQYLTTTEAFYARHGGKTIILARFAPIVRTFAPFIAGMGHMRYLRFLASSVVGTMLWVGGFCLLGFAFGNLPVVRNNLSLLMLAIIAVSLAPTFIAILRNKFAAKANRA
ncbi:DedA family protein [Vogesella oryzae]|uniref:DedA family protein n=1 Tax=Vogesella oryzae TaxID=1735285 RepID=UPI001C2E2ABB|nr:DedA family protein [Vogesella oryzae]